MVEIIQRVPVSHVFMLHPIPNSFLHDMTRWKPGGYFSSGLWFRQVFSSFHVGCYSPVLASSMSITVVKWIWIASDELQIASQKIKTRFTKNSVLRKRKEERTTRHMSPQWPPKYNWLHRERYSLIMIIILKETQFRKNTTILDSIEITQVYIKAIIHN